ncbi:flagellar basal-body P-ring protein [Desulfocapsa sulfexigens DSM 10523]|uniref:Flagellar P-ring protein n=1 Tax=Desulfocapsa sulfexigens (strain DSM 10523 / SB164P1) TaxID=1167006 RepID=M1PJ79_DESSD|nr:flagellar basal body P-ring protein FlgI [Desulfocapsa sulfexigens]AGF79630.1 flagellar basal-body P-ring protein [Desulfocapsa sulfexigens DSM 10523]
MRTTVSILLTGFILLCLFCTNSSGARIKDIAELKGVRNNQLIGYGLITGLAGTGDDLKKVLFTRQALYNMLVRQGITVNPDEFENIKVNNVAAVMVTASLPPFAKPGSTIDVQVSSIGDAKSLAGGNLLMTQLKGPDGKVYAVSQGPLTIGAFSFGGKAAKAQRNHPTVGRITGGAIIEKTAPGKFADDGTLSYSLRTSDFTTAANMSDAINAKYGIGTAFPVDSATIKVIIPQAFLEDKVHFVTSIESMRIETDTNAKVVVNERTGTIVMGKDVRLSTVAVSHGNLSLVVKETMEVTQPNPLATGQTVVAPETSIDIVEDDGQLMLVEEGVSIGAVADALNAIGATPRDLIAIFQAIKVAGAMHGELIVL